MPPNQPWHSASALHLDKGGDKTTKTPAVWPLGMPGLHTIQAVEAWLAADVGLCRGRNSISLHWSRQRWKYVRQPQGKHRARRSSSLIFSCQTGHVRALPCQESLPAAPWAPGKTPWFLWWAHTWADGAGSSSQGANLQGHCITEAQSHALVLLKFITFLVITFLKKKRINIGRYFYYKWRKHAVEQYYNMACLRFCKVCVIVCECVKQQPLKPKVVLKERVDWDICSQQEEQILGFAAGPDEEDCLPSGGAWGSLVQWVWRRKM